MLSIQQTLESQNKQSIIFMCNIIYYYFINIIHSCIIKKINMLNYLIRLNNLLKDYYTEMYSLVLFKICGIEKFVWTLNHQPMPNPEISLFKDKSKYDHDASLCKINR